MQLDKNGNKIFAKKNVYKFLSNEVIINIDLQKIKDGHYIDNNEINKVEIERIITESDLHTWKLTIEVSDTSLIDHLKDISTPWRYKPPYPGWIENLSTNTSDNEERYKSPIII